MWYSLGSVKILWWIYCPRHLAISSIQLLLKNIFWNTKMPAEMQMRKRCKTIKTRSIVPSNLSERTRVTGYSLTNDTHKLSSGKIITCSQTSNRTRQKLASSYKIRTREKIPSAAPSLQLFQPAEGGVYLKKTLARTFLKQHLVLEAYFQTENLQQRVIIMFSQPLIF